MVFIIIISSSSSSSSISSSSSSSSCCCCCCCCCSSVIVVVSHCCCLVCLFLWCVLGLLFFKTNMMGADVFVCISVCFSGDTDQATKYQNAMVRGLLCTCPKQYLWQSI